MLPQEKVSTNVPSSTSRHVGTSNGQVSDTTIASAVTGISPARLADPLYDETKAAELFGMSPKTFQAWRVSGKGPRFLKLGPGLRSAVRYRLSDLLLFLEEAGRHSTSEG